MKEAGITYIKITKRKQNGKFKVVLNTRFLQLKNNKPKEIVIEPFQ